MYGNMTREEMIQRLYEGNFTTGELERQLIAKLFEQCCGGGGSSGGGGVYLVNANTVDDNIVLDKTAKEIYEAYQSSVVIVSELWEDGTQNFFTFTSARLSLEGVYEFTDINLNIYSASTGDDYPRTNDGGK